MPLSSLSIITFITVSVAFSFFLYDGPECFSKTWVLRQALPSSSEASTRCHVSPISWCYTWHLEDASEEDGRAGWKAQVFGKTRLSVIKVKRSYCLKSKGNRTSMHYLCILFTLNWIYRITCWPHFDYLNFLSLFAEVHWKMTTSFFSFCFSR